MYGSTDLSDWRGTDDPYRQNRHSDSAPYDSFFNNYAHILSTMANHLHNPHHRYNPTVLEVHMKRFLAHLLFTILFIAITLHYADEIDSATIPPVYALPDKVTSYEPVETLTFEATAYYYGHTTSTGTSPIAYRTAAVDSRIMPYGTEFTVDAFPDVIWIAEDCGNYWSDEVSRSGYYRHIRGNRIDLRMPDKRTCLEFGRQEVKVRVVE